MSIITGRGDEGETDLLFNKRIAKSSLRMEVLGSVDELNAALGMARAAGLSEPTEQVIDRLQELLVGLMGEFATLPEDQALYEEKGYSKVTAADVDWATDTARSYEKQGIRFKGWARPGVEHSLARAAMDMARPIARRAERSAWKLHESGEPVSATTRLFLNRISDLLWILARAESSPL